MAFFMEYINYMQFLRLHEPKQVFLVEHRRAPTTSHSSADVNYQIKIWSIYSQGIKYFSQIRLCFFYNWIAYFSISRSNINFPILVEILTKLMYFRRLDEAIEHIGSVLVKHLPGNFISPYCKNRLALQKFNCSRVAHKSTPTMLYSIFPRFLIFVIFHLLMQS